MREKDRVERWREEDILCQTDLECTARWFKHQEETWSKRLTYAKGVGKVGHICYAEKQRHVWELLRKRAVCATEEASSLTEQAMITV